VTFTDPRTLVSAIPVMLLALTVHEWAHAYTAWRLGDPTARALGRMTLNPLAHLDLFGTLAMVLIGFGWARPVPVDPRYLASPRRDMMWIAAAGPASNLVQATLFGALFRFLGTSSAATVLPEVFGHMIVYGVFINCALAVFNLLPVPPLDGSKILYGLFPGITEVELFRLERYGPMVLMGLILLGALTGFSLLWLVIGPPVQFLISLFSGMTI
jgi:Zn-dependent protease